MYRNSLYTHFVSVDAFWYSYNFILHFLMYVTFVFYIPEDGKYGWSKGVRDKSLYKLILIYLLAIFWYHYSIYFNNIRLSLFRIQNGVLLCFPFSVPYFLKELKISLWHYCAVCHLFQLQNELNNFHEIWWYVVKNQPSYFLSFYNPL